ncbi:hypothetical protein QN355_06380 [Cryobacterium sp. 10S3]|uniref:hypothetical protein n=1 Tax=Cryobacterium sp. 10S3 TaxID=3048582 RepID=UPI002AC995DB|nr:hypothetical protein [Cryobacterium sp. 10S3]MEB0286175.1 hypothetical protein [Cryobacterium sp. 10S3]WPX12233.1 hypothetical protein RHM57_11120 [Cryobacterium sp. 10S3]
MKDTMKELKSTVARLATVDERRAALIEYRDRQVADILAAGHTWLEVQAVTGLSARGLKLAVDRHRARPPK